MSQKQPIHPTPAFSLREQGYLEVGDFSAFRLNLESIDGSIPILIHSDQGVQFSSPQYYQFVKKNNITASMSNKGTPTDNAVIESFFATLKLECIYRIIIKSKESANEIINEFIHYYNNIKLQLKTSKTPAEIRFSI